MEVKEIKMLLITRHTVHNKTEVILNVILNFFGCNKH